MAEQCQSAHRPAHCDELRRAWRPVRPPEGPHLPVHHRDVGALLLLRDARAARPLHDEISAAAGARRQTSLGLAGLKSALEAVFGPLDVQPLSSQIYGLLHGAGLSHADFRRASRRPRARPAPHRRPRRDPHGDRPFHDGGRAAVPVRAARAHPRQRRVQAEYFDPGRRALCARRPRAATAPIPSSMSASMSARFWRRSSAARSARRRAGITALPPPASAC